MEPKDWKMMSYIGIALGVFFFAIGGWIWLNVEGYMGWQGWLKYFEYRLYPMPLFITGFVFIAVGLASSWRASEAGEVAKEPREAEYEEGGT